MANLPEPNATLNAAHLAQALSVASERLVPGERYIIVARVSGPAVIYTGTFTEIGLPIPGLGRALRFEDVRKLDGTPSAVGLTERSHFYIPYSPEQIDQLTRRTREHEMNAFGHTEPGMRLPLQLKSKIMSYLGGRRPRSGSSTRKSKSKGKSKRRATRNRRNH